MLDAVVGAVIMVVATTSLVYSIEVAERAFDQAGRYPLNSDEREILQNIGLDNESQNYSGVRILKMHPERWAG